MANNIDVEFCGDLIARVGVQLLDMSKHGERAQNWEGMFQHFMKANTRAVDQIKSALAQKYPDIPWSNAEFECDEQRADAFVGDYWLCDPIDGAINFLQGLPCWSTSLCLIHNGQLQYSFIYDPCQKELFHAVAGEGAFLNRERIHVSQKQSMEYAIVATAQPSFVMKEIENTQRTTRAISQIMPRVGALRTLGGVSLQLAYVACGRFDGYWEYGNDMTDWLAGSLIIRESGGVVTDIQGRDFNWGAPGIIAANPVMHQSLQTEV
jgi:myo-inositol-1(or 4)-monophosphatase